MADQKRACSFCRKNPARLTVQGKNKGRNSTVECRMLDYRLYTISHKLCHITKKSSDSPDCKVDVDLEKRSNIQ